MLKLTLKNIWKIKLLDDEKQWLLNLYKVCKSRWYEFYLFGSRLDGYGADIDIMIKPAPDLKQLLEFETIFSLYSDTKLDLIPYNEKTKLFFENILSR